MVIHRRSKSIRKAGLFVFKEIVRLRERHEPMPLARYYRVLKPGRWAVIEFNNSDGAVFEVIKRAVTSGGL